MEAPAGQDHREDLERMLNFEALRSIARRGVIHIGAHQGQEIEQYFDFGFERIVLIEANPEWHDFLVSEFGHDARIRIFNYAICDEEGVVDFHVHTSRSGSTEPASILRMKRFSEIVQTLHTPKVLRVPATTLDSLFDKQGLSGGDYNFLNMDIQGAELLALKGADGLLSSLDVIVSEVNVLEMYDGGATEDDIVAFLALRGFEKRLGRYHNLTENGAEFPAWGECLFMRGNGSRHADEIVGDAVDALKSS